MFSIINVVYTNDLILLRNFENDDTFYSDIFCYMWKSIWLCNRNANLIVFEESKNTFGFGIWMSKIKNIYFVSNIKWITFRIYWLNSYIFRLHSTFKNSIWSLLNHKTGHPMYVITYPKCGMEFSTLLVYAWSQPSEKLVLT